MKLDLLMPLFAASRFAKHCCDPSPAFDLALQAHSSLNKDLKARPPLGYGIRAEDPLGNRSDSQRRLQPRLLRGNCLGDATTISPTDARGDSYISPLGKPFDEGV